MGVIISILFYVIILQFLFVYIIEIKTLYNNPSYRESSYRESSYRESSYLKPSYKIENFNCSDDSYPLRISELNDCHSKKFCMDEWLFPVLEHGTITCKAEEDLCKTFIWGFPKLKNHEKLVKGYAEEVFICDYEDKYRKSYLPHDELVHNKKLYEICITDYYPEILNNGINSQIICSHLSFYCEIENLNYLEMIEDIIYCTDDNNIIKLSKSIHNINYRYWI